MSFIEIRSAGKAYGARTVLADFSLDAGAGERIVILGQSGCGKTTVLRLLAGFIAPDSGSVRIDDELVSAEGRILKGPEERNFGMVFQDLALWPHLTVRGNLEFGLRAKKVPQHERDRRVMEMLDLVQLAAYADSKPAELSGGQQQRVALARALALHPKALLMDEPLSSLDPELNRRLRKEILRLQAATGFTLVYVTHSHEEARELGTRVVTMKHGRVEKTWPAKETGSCSQKQRSITPPFPGRGA